MPEKIKLPKLPELPPLPSGGGGLSPDVLDFLIQSVDKMQFQGAREQILKMLELQAKTLQELAELQKPEAKKEG